MAGKGRGGDVGKGRVAGKREEERAAKFSGGPSSGQAGGWVLEPDGDITHQKSDMPPPSAFPPHFSPPFFLHNPYIPHSSPLSLGPRPSRHDQPEAGQRGAHPEGPSRLGRTPFPHTWARDAPTEGTKAAEDTSTQLSTPL